MYEPIHGTDSHFFEKSPFNGPRPLTGVVKILDAGSVNRDFGILTIDNCKFTMENDLRSLNGL